MKRISLSQDFSFGHRRVLETVQIVAVCELIYTIGKPGITASYNINARDDLMNNDLKDEILAISYYDKSYYVVCFDISESGELLCYFVTDQASKYEMPLVTIHHVNGRITKFKIKCERQFLIPARYVRKRLLKCSQEDLDLAIKCYLSQPTIVELENKYKVLRHQLQLVGHTKESKELRREVNRINEIINRRKKCVFEETNDRKKAERTDKFRNFRSVPGENGIVQVYHGGGCSGK